MKIAIFNQGEDFTVGFSTENDPEFEWHQKHYHVLEIPETEVKDLQKSFNDFKAAQKKIETYFSLIQEGKLKTVGMIETDKWLKDLRKGIE